MKAKRNSEEAGKRGVRASRLLLAGKRPPEVARQGRLIVFIDEYGVSERPTRVRTWSVRGETPTLQFHFNWHQLSLIAGMHFTGLCFRLHEGTVAREQVVDFLKALLAHFRRPLLIILDSSRLHRSHLVRDYVASTAGRIQLHFLPGYAPEMASARVRRYSNRPSLSMIPQHPDVRSPSNTFLQSFRP